MKDTQCPLRTVLPRAPLAWIAIAFLSLGAGCVAAGLLPASDAGATLRRVVPLLVFLGSVIVLAELAAEAEVFDVVATRIAIVGRGDFRLLFLLCGAFAAATTAALNLDTTAVLLTPVMLATGARIGVAPMPLAMSTVWLANTASLLLPVSNLTNLLAMRRVALSAPQFAQRMVWSELASVAATMLCLWLLYWRRAARGGAVRYAPPPPHQPRDRVLLAVAGAACGLFVLLVLVGIPLAYVSLGCAGGVLVAFAARRRSVLRWRLLPWQLLAFVSGLFLVVETVNRHGLGGLLRSVVGSGATGGSVYRAGLVGAGLANLVNNLPAYVAVEPVIGPDRHTQLLGLLIGTNVGPLVTPFASLATLLWYSRCRAYGVTLSWRRFMLTGLVTATACLLAATTALVLTG